MIIIAYLFHAVCAPYLFLLSGWSAPLHPSVVCTFAVTCSIWQPWDIASIAPFPSLIANKHGARSVEGERSISSSHLQMMPIA